MNRVSTRDHQTFPLVPSLLLSTGVHLVAIVLILFSPSWGPKGYQKAPRTFMVNLVAVPSLSGAITPAPSGSPSPAPKTKEVEKAPSPAPKVREAEKAPASTPKVREVEKTVAAKPAKESKVAELKRTEEINPQPRPKPPGQAKEPLAERVKERSLPPLSARVPRPAPPASSFKLPPLPSSVPREQMAHLQSGGASGAEGRGTGIASTAASSAPRESGTTAVGQGKSGKAEGLLGVASLLPGVSVDNPDFQFTYYIVVIQNKIASNWNPPFAGGKTDRETKTLVHFRILRNGQVRDVRVESSSGASLLDQSAVRAISMSNPLPPLPQRFSDDSLGVHFSFELEGGRG